MKIMVAGSTDFAEGEQVHGEFVSACKDLGASLAEAGHTIVVGSDGEKTADRQVVFGANSSGKRAKVVIINSQRKAAPFDQDREQLSSLDLSYVRSRGPRTVGRIRQILEADGVITIGGGRGTAQLGYTAPALERPVLAIPAFGGASEDIWDEYVDQDLERLRFYRSGFLDGKVQSLSGKNWDASKADLAVKVMEELVNQNPYRSQRVVPQAVIVIFQLFLLTGWVALFVNPFDSFTVSFFLLLGIAALLGTGIRTSLRFLTEIRPRIPVRRLATEGMLGLLLAYALALFYLLGVHTVTGDQVTIGEAKDFQRIAVNMSLLGLAAGVLLERATEQVMRRLETVVSKEE